MAFVENIEVYENYVQSDAFTTADDAAAEVTKEKESNKIYVVESGDCLSVIALDHDTKVADIMALNGLENADSLREGQELIIAVPEPDLKIRLTVGEVYEEDYEEEPVIKENDSWYTNQEEVLEEGVAGHRERNDIVVYENGAEVSRELAHQKIMTAAKAAVVSVERSCRRHTLSRLPVEGLHQDLEDAGEECIKVWTGHARLEQPCTHPVREL